ncbi:MAG: hypothetical protein R2849_04990 [Thermomicrobiales bacterium]
MACARVQYYDKARMEITNPGSDSDSIWYVTNGLLVVKLVTGKMQVGDNRTATRPWSTSPGTTTRAEPDVRNVRHAARPATRIPSAARSPNESSETDRPASPHRLG